MDMGVTQSSCRISANFTDFDTFANSGSNSADGFHFGVYGPVRGLQPPKLKGGGASSHEVEPRPDLGRAPRSSTSVQALQSLASCGTLPPETLAKFWQTIMEVDDSDAIDRRPTWAFSSMSTRSSCATYEDRPTLQAGQQLLVDLQRTQPLLLKQMALPGDMEPGVGNLYTIRHLSGAHQHFEQSAQSLLRECTF